ncbi:MAG: hypothetical protein FJX94_02015 [Bacteroidetes bacterium]|nr:hypothetical protein [Bacteroidota bacterium]
MQTCLFCGHMVQLVHVHGHYQCPVCNTNALPCCDGDNCDTNLLLNQPLVHGNTTASIQEQKEQPSA